MSSLIRNKNCCPNRSRRVKWNIFIITGLLVVSLLPLCNYDYFSVPITIYNGWFKLLLLGLPVVSMAACYRIDSGLAHRDKTSLFILIALLSLLLVDIHLMYIDIPSRLSCQYFPDATNADFQKFLHDNVMRLSPGTIPHSYRFLPDSFVSLLTFLTNDFEFSKFVYRETFMLLLLFAIYYYSRIYYSHQVAIVTLLFYAVVYQISIRDYAGQLADPMSHLCFILAFIFLELDMFAYLCVTVLIGILAKESIAVLAVYYVFKQLRGKRSPVKPILLVLACVGIIAAIRLYIVPDFTYGDISGAGTWPLIKNNLLNYKRSWHQVFFTVGIFLPFVLLSWKTTAGPLKKLVLFLLPVLVLAHTIIGFLWETRNLIPAAIPMALITAQCLMNTVNQSLQRQSAMTVDTET